MCGRVGSSASARCPLNEIHDGTHPKTNQSQNSQRQSTTQSDHQAKREQRTTFSTSSPHISTTTQHIMAPKDVADTYEGDDVPLHQQLQSPSASLKRSCIQTEAISTATAPSSPERQLKRQRCESVTNETSPKKMKKRLRWSTITIHEFGVGLGGSSVPGKGGPSIGLSDKPEFTWTTKVGQMAERVEGVHRFTPEERKRLLENAGVSEGMILRFSRETNIINCSRRRTLVETIAERKEAKRQRRQQRRNIESPRPCSSFLNRPQMIPVNYV